MFSYISSHLLLLFEQSERTIQGQEGQRSKHSVHGEVTCFKFVLANTQPAVHRQM